MPKLPSRHYALANRTTRPRPASHSALKPSASNPEPDATLRRKFIGHASNVSRPKHSSASLELWFPSEAVTHYDLPLPSIATEDSAYIDIERWLKATCSGIVEERTKINQLIKWRCEILAGSKPPQSRATCPEIGFSHSAGPVSLVYGSGDHRVNPIGYYTMPCLVPGKRDFIHLNELTPALTVNQLRSDNWLWAALRHRIARRPPSKIPERAVLIEEALMGIDRPRPSDNGPAVSGLTSVSGSTSSTASGSGSFVSSLAPTILAPSTPDNTTFRRTPNPHRNASPPTPPRNALFEMDEEADSQLLNWSVSAHLKAVRERRALSATHGTSTKASKSRHSPLKINITFHLPGGDEVKVTLPATKRGICLGSHTALLRYEGVLKVPLVWVLSPSDKDLNSIWVPHKWRCSIPLTQNTTVIKLDKNIITQFDQAL